MEKVSNTNPLLDLMDRPAFCVRDGIVIQSNPAAQQRLVTVGTNVADLLKNDYRAYADFTGGCLYLTVTTAGVPCGTTVTRTQDCDIFTMDQESDFSHMQALALAAQKLSVPLNDVMNLADALQTNSRTRKQAAQIRRALYQLQRIVCNMSDLPRYDHRTAAKLEFVDIGSIFDEVMEKVDSAISPSKCTLHYTGLMQIVMGLADREMLERAINNLVSNAIKFSPEHSTITAKLTRNGNMLYFSIQDEGSGVDTYAQRSMFNRYLREPSIEDGRFGIGLGMALIRAVASNHGGTVLIDQPDGHGTRITMTISIRQSQDNVLRSPVTLPISDYAGGWDHMLLELSDVLGADSYKHD